MAIKAVVAASQTMRVTCLVSYIYADPGIGKTSLAYTANAPILFDFDAGAHRSGKLRRGATVPVEHWLDVANIEASDVEGYQSIVIDTAGRALDMIKTHLAENKANRQNDGSLKLKAQGIANELFKNWITRIRSYGKDVIILAHAAEDKKGDDIIFRPDVGGKNKNELYRQADLMAYLTNVSGEQGKQVRMLNFSPSTAYHAKNSGGLGDVALPNLVNEPTFLAGLIQKSKDYINSLTEEQVKELQHLDDLQNWKNDCLLCENAEGLNNLFSGVDREHPYFAQMRVAFADAVKSLPVMLDKEAGRYVDKEASAKSTPTPVTDPTVAETQNRPEPKPEQKQAAASTEAQSDNDGASNVVSFDRVRVLREITNAINLDELKKAWVQVPDSISHNDCGPFIRAFTKRNAELTPMDDFTVDEIIHSFSEAPDRPQLGKLWKEKVGGFIGIISEQHMASLNDAFFSADSFFVTEQQN